MKLVRESIFSSILRSFCISFFSVIGICIAFFVILLIFGAGQGSKGFEVSNYDIVVPDTNGRKYNFSSNAPLILRINIEGEIGKNISAQKIQAILNESHSGQLKNKNIRGLLIYMNTPGGGANASESIYYALKDYALKYQIPIYTYVDGLCASGGMHIACASDKIYSSPSSIVGSVGAVSMYFNVSGAMDKVGISNKTITQGMDKDSMNPYRPWVENEGTDILPIVKSLYEQFVSVVSQARPKLTKDLLVNDYGAKIYIASEAEKLGYIDGSGYQLNQVTEMLAQEAQINDNYRVISMQPKLKLSDVVNFSSFARKIDFKSLFFGPVDLSNLKQTAKDKEPVQFLYTAQAKY